MDENKAQEEIYSQVVRAGKEHTSLMCVLPVQMIII